MPRISFPSLETGFWPEKTCHQAETDPRSCFMSGRTSTRVEGRGRTPGNGGGKEAGVGVHGRNVGVVLQQAAEGGEVVIDADGAALEAGAEDKGVAAGRAPASAPSERQVL